VARNFGINTNYGLGDRSKRI